MTALSLAGRPLAYPNTLSWLRTSIGGRWRGPLAAYVGTWMNIPFALVTGVLGSLAAGALFLVHILSSGSDEGSMSFGWLAWFGVPGPPAFLSNSVTALGALGVVAGLAFSMLLGAILGFLYGAFLPWIFVLSLSAGDPLLGLLALAISVAFGPLLGLGYTLYRTACEPWLLVVTGARRLSRREHEFLMPILHECAQRLDLPNVPRLLIDDTRTRNSLAYTRHIVINQGLLDEFNYDRDVVAAVLSHELAHWRNGDPVAAAFIRGLALPLYLAYAFVTGAVRALRQYPSAGYGAAGAVALVLAWLVAWPILVTVNYIVMPFQALDSRSAEYRADQAAVATGYRSGLRIALARFRQSFEGSRNGWVNAVCATHPPNELRLEALEEPGKSYLVPDPERPITPLPVTVIGGPLED